VLTLGAVSARESGDDEDDTGTDDARRDGDASDSVGPRHGADTKALRHFRHAVAGEEGPCHPRQGRTTLAKKTTSPPTAKSAPTPRPATKRPTKRGLGAALEAESVLLSTLAPLAPSRDEYALQLGSGFSLLTRRVSGGAVTASRVSAGAVLEVSYRKEPSHPAQPGARLGVGVVLHEGRGHVPRRRRASEARDDAHRHLGADAGRSHGGGE
jgi:hypothetical protein